MSQPVPPPATPGWVQRLLLPGITQWIAGAILLMALASSVAVGLLVQALNELKVNGPVYVEIKKGNDLTADILPPPLYVIEGFLTLHEMQAHPGGPGIGELRTRLARLDKEFETRRQYWSEQALPDELRSILDGQVVPTGQRFFAAATAQYLPAIAGGDVAVAAAALRQLGAIYAEHRAAVDRLVTGVEGAVAAAEATAAARQAEVSRTIAFIMGLVFVTILGVGYGMHRGVTRPIRQMTEGMNLLASGRFDIAIPGLGRRDELGEAAQALVVFRDNMLATRRLEAEQADEREAAHQAKAAALTAMAQTIEAEATLASSRVTEFTAEMAQTARAMSSAAARSAGNATEASDAAGVALSTAQTVASAAEQLSASIQEITRQVNTATDATRQAVDAGEATRESIDTLSERAKDIAEITRVIADIAERTNLLALNATIEAARAGEAGRGFAVVAGEVKLLATQTARSTEAISGKLAAITEAAASAVAQGTRIVGAIHDIESMSSSIAAAVEQQGAATLEIARSVTETASAANIAAARTQEAVVDATRVGTQAASVVTASELLDQAVHQLGEAVIRTVRTSTTEVDRRREERFDVGAAGRLRCGGREFDVRVVNISTGGAMLTGCSGLVGGETAQLSVPPFDVPCKIHRLGERGELHVTFAEGVLSPERLAKLMEPGRRAA